MIVYIRGAVTFIILAWLAACLVGSACFGAPLAHEIAIGDSIAVGIATEMHSVGYAKVGNSPKAVLELLARVPLNDLHGNVVFLSTGLSNDPSQARYVQTMIDMLTAAGAKIIVLGVGEAIPGSAEINNWLADLCTQQKIGFAYGWEGVHPPDYGYVLNYLHRVECTHYKVCAI